MTTDHVVTRSVAGLAAKSAERSSATVARVEAAIKRLQEQGKRVSVRAITAADAALLKEEFVNNELVEKKPPLAESTILNNNQANDVYEKARPPEVRQRARRPRRRDKVLERKTKAELIDIIHDTRAERDQFKCIAQSLAFPDDEDDD